MLLKLQKRYFTFYISYYHITGALCARLSGDAAKVQGATGARVGSVLQGIAGKVQGTSGARVGLVLQVIAGKV